MFFKFYFFYFVSFAASHETCFLRNRLHSFINIIGLAIGMACVIMLLLLSGSHGPRVNEAKSSEFGVRSVEVDSYKRVGEKIESPA